VEQVIDVGNVMDFDILLNVAANWEGRNFNLYIARRDGPGERFFLVPWDYDMTFHEPRGILRNCLTDRLLKDCPGYPSRLKARWKELRAGPLADAAVATRIDEMERFLQGAAERNFRRWPLPEGETFEQHVATLRSWLRDRLAYLDAYYDKLDGGDG
jgi:hypothetical protein